MADRSLSSFQNLQAIKDQGFYSIIASRWGHLSATMQEEMLDCADYRPLHDGDEEDDVHYKTLSFELGLYSRKRAKKDASDRENLIQKATEILASGRCDNKRGAKQYLKNSPSPPGGLGPRKNRQGSSI